MKQVLISMRSQQHGGPLSLEADGTGTAVHRPKAVKSTDEEQYNNGPKPTVFVSFTCLSTKRAFQTACWGK